MELPPVSLIGLEGMQRASARVAASAAEIAGGESEDLVGALVSMKLGQHQFEASAQIVKTGDEMLGTVLDILA